MELTGAQALVKSLEMEGVEVIFGLPGGAILPVYDPILDSPIRHILVRHEQGRAYGRRLRAGNRQAGSGDGHKWAWRYQRRDPLADAYMDSIRWCASAASCHERNRTDAFQESDTTGITLGSQSTTGSSPTPPISPGRARGIPHRDDRSPGTGAHRLPERRRELHHGVYWPDGVDLPGYQPPSTPTRRRYEPPPRSFSRPNGRDLRGRRHLEVEGSEVLRELVDLTGIPVVTTLMAVARSPTVIPCPRDARDARQLHRCHLHAEGDLLLALGSRFDDRVTGKVSAFAPGAKVVHVDIDKAEIGKVRRPEVGILADCRLAIEALVEEIRAFGPIDHSRLAPWIATLRRWQAEFPCTYDRHEPASTGSAGSGASRRPTLKPQFVIETLRALTPPTRSSSRRGPASMWLPILVLRVPEHLGQFGWPRDHGLRRAGGDRGEGRAPRPDGVAVDGDGCFQMTAQELATATAERIPVKIAILNNAYLGMVRQWQHMFYEERYSEVYLSPDLPTTSDGPSRWLYRLRVESPEEVTPAIEKANEIDDRRWSSTSGQTRWNRCSRWCLPRIQRRHRRVPVQGTSDAEALQ